MAKFQKFYTILWVSLICGTIANLLWFVTLHIFPVPLLGTQNLFQWSFFLLCCVAGPLFGGLAVWGSVYVICRFHSISLSSSFLKAFRASGSGILLGGLWCFGYCGLNVLTYLPEINYALNYNQTLSHLHQASVWLAFLFFVQLLLLLSYKKQSIWKHFFYALPMIPGIVIQPSQLEQFGVNLHYVAFCHLLAENYLNWVLLGALLGVLVHFHASPYTLLKNTVKFGILSGLCISGLLQISNIVPLQTDIISYWNGLQILQITSVSIFLICTGHTFFYPLQHEGRIILSFFTKTNSKSELHKRIEYIPTQFFLESYHDHTENPDTRLYIGCFVQETNYKYMIYLDEQILIGELCNIFQTISRGLCIEFKTAMLEKMKVTRIHKTKTISIEKETQIPFLRPGDRFQFQQKNTSNNPFSWDPLILEVSFASVY